MTPETNKRQRKKGRTKEAPFPNVNTDFTDSLLPCNLAAFPLQAARAPTLALHNEGATPDTPRGFFIVVLYIGILFLFIIVSYIGILYIGMLFL